MTKEVFTKWFTAKYTSVMTKKRVSSILGTTYDLQGNLSLGENTQITKQQEQQLPQKTPENVELKKRLTPILSQSKASNRLILESPDTQEEKIIKPVAKEKTKPVVKVVKTTQKNNFAIPHKKKLSIQNSIYSPVERMRSKPLTDTPRPTEDPNMRSPKLDMTWDEMHVKGAAVPVKRQEPVSIRTPVDKTLNTPIYDKPSATRKIKLIITPNSSKSNNIEETNTEKTIITNENNSSSQKRIAEPKENLGLTEILNEEKSKKKQETSKNDVSTTTTMKKTITPMKDTSNYSQTLADGGSSSSQRQTLMTPTLEEKEQTLSQHLLPTKLSIGSEKMDVEKEEEEEVAEKMEIDNKEITEKMEIDDEEEVSKLKINEKNETNTSIVIENEDNLKTIDKEENEKRENDVIEKNNLINNMEEDKEEREEEEQILMPQIENEKLIINKEENSNVTKEENVYTEENISETVEKNSTENQVKENVEGEDEEEEEEEEFFMPPIQSEKVTLGSQSSDEDGENYNNIDSNNNNNNNEEQIEQNIMKKQSDEIWASSEKLSINPEPSVYENEESNILEKEKEKLNLEKGKEELNLEKEKEELNLEKEKEESNIEKLDIASTEKTSPSKPVAVKEQTPIEKIKNKSKEIEILTLSSTPPVQKKSSAVAKKEKRNSLAMEIELEGQEAEEEEMQIPEEAEEEMVVIPEMKSEKMNFSKMEEEEEEEEENLDPPPFEEEDLDPLPVLIEEQISTDNENNIPQQNEEEIPKVEKKEEKSSELIQPENSSELIQPENEEEEEEEVEEIKQKKRTTPIQKRKSKEEEGVEEEEHHHKLTTPIQKKKSSIGTEGESTETEEEEKVEEKIKKKSATPIQEKKKSISKEQENEEEIILKKKKSSIIVGKNDESTDFSMDLDDEDEAELEKMQNILCDDHIYSEKLSLPAIVTEVPSVEKLPVKILENEEEQAGLELLTEQEEPVEMEEDPIEMEEEEPSIVIKKKSAAITEPMEIDDQNDHEIMEKPEEEEGQQVLKKKKIPQSSNNEASPQHDPSKLFTEKMELVNKKIAEAQSKSKLKSIDLLEEKIKQQQDEDRKKKEEALALEAKKEAEAKKEQKQKKLWSKIMDLLRKFSDLYEEYEDENIDSEAFVKAGEKMIKKLGAVHLAVLRSPGKHLNEKKEKKFLRKLNRVRECFQEEFEDGKDVTSFMMKLNKKSDEDDPWLYNYVTNEACLDNEDEDIVFRLDMETYFKLYDYQRDGIAWLWELFGDRIGGILADDMGLGKTVQTCAFLRGIMGKCNVRRVLLVVPVSTMSSWENHITEWTGKRYRYFRGSEKVKMESFEKITTKGGILITSYETLRSSINILTNTKFDYAILDEGHKCKNPHSLQSQAIRKLRIRKCHRLMLTGTYMQNKMEELWALVDWCTQGKILGPYRDFRKCFAAPIDDANVRDASRVQREIAETLRGELRELLEPYIMRRTKNEVGLGVNVQKNEIVVWVKTSQIQRNIYNQFLQSESVQIILNSSKSPLAALTALKKICDHPFILNKTIAQVEDNEKKDVLLLAQNEDLKQISELSQNLTCENIVNTSGKMLVLQSLVKSFKEQNHKVIIFTGYRKTMKLIQTLLENMEVKYFSMDGTTDFQQRQKWISEFNDKESDHTAFCSTTGVGGLGITLTGANRVIIFDPDWNPANDSQAADRAFRLGQTKNVIVYRLVTCETLEDKIYRRQVTKRGLLEMIDTGSRVRRFFSRDELRKVFTPLTDCDKSTTQELMMKHHPKPFKSYPELEKHILEIKNLDGVSGISHHDSLFKLMEVVQTEEEVTPEQIEKKAKEDEKIQKALDEKLKRVREDKQREKAIQAETGGSPILKNKRKRRKLAAKKNGWDHETYNQYAGTPPEKKKKKKKNNGNSRTNSPSTPSSKSDDVNMNQNEKEKEESAERKKVLGKRPLSQIVDLVGEETGARKRIFSPRIKDPFSNVPFSPKLKKKKRLPMSPKSKNNMSQIMNVQRNLAGEKRKQPDERNDVGQPPEKKRKLDSIF